MTSILNQNQSRALVTTVNLAKLLALAVLVPAATVGIAQRAVELAPDGTDTEVVAGTTTVGALCGITGALLLGRITDRFAQTAKGRWWFVAGGATCALVGLSMMMLASSPWMLAAGWGVAQLGCSGAMTVLRALLAIARPTQRRRGATVMIALTYLGALIPILILILLPTTVWTASLVLAILAVAVPAIVAFRSPAPSTAPLGSASAPQELPADETPARGQRLMETERRRARLPWPVVLLTQCGVHMMLSAYLAYHALDIAEDFGGEWSNAATQLSLLTLAAAVIGLLLTTLLLVARPALLEHIPKLLIVSGVLLAGSVALRPFAQSSALLVVLLFCSGVGVALTSSSLLVAALSEGLNGRLGRRIGAYSAVTPIGQLLGPPLGLLIIRASPQADEYQVLFLVIACVPLVWTALVAITQRRHPSNDDAYARDPVETYAT